MIDVVCVHGIDGEMEFRYFNLVFVMCGEKHFGFRGIKFCNFFSDRRFLFVNSVYSLVKIINSISIRTFVVYL